MLSTQTLVAMPVNSRLRMFSPAQLGLRGRCGRSRCSASSLRSSRPATALSASTICQSQVPSTSSLPASSGALAHHAQAELLSDSCGDDGPPPSAQVGLGSVICRCTTFTARLAARVQQRCALTATTGIRARNIEAGEVEHAALRCEGVLHVHNDQRGVA